MIKAIYDTADGYSCIVENTVDIPVQVPLSPQFSFFSQTFHPLSPNSGSIIVNQPFYLYVELQSTTPFPIHLTSATLQLVTMSILSISHFDSQSQEDSIGATCLGSSSVIGSKGFNLSKDNRYSAWYQLVVSSSGDAVQLGSLDLHWKR